MRKAIPIEEKKKLLDAWWKERLSGKSAKLAAKIVGIHTSDTLKRWDRELDK